MVKEMLLSENIIIKITMIILGVIRVIILELRKLTFIKIKQILWTPIKLDLIVHKPCETGESRNCTEYFSCFQKCNF